MFKAALNQFARSIALDLAPKQVRVNTVNPGATKTNLLEGLMSKEKIDTFMEEAAAITPNGRVGEAEEVAKAIAFLASNESSFTTGIHLLIDGGAHLNTNIVPVE
ncbi:hypothetical protein EB796_006487 [Bugula neritina]|uniref:Uncharacterized protein n=1 Tax=Bugula neritina TaxID=10212 RepID=A0A7J7KCE9_BUGNE|nr:hypothetical protein EB796_006487 [Bugula neritina]